MSKKKLTFTKSDYIEDLGLVPDSWGLQMWNSMFCVAINYPNEPTEQNKKDYYKFYSSLKNILPCKICSTNMKKHEKILPLTRKVFENRETLSRWVYDMHCLVNKMLGKKYDKTYEETRDIYENFRAHKIYNPDDPTTNDAKFTGVRSKCVINIVPVETKCKTFNIDKKCILRKRKK